MKENEVKVKSLAFAKRIVHAYQYLCDEKKEFILSKQLLRSGTSIGANIAEAQYGSSRKDLMCRNALLAGTSRFLRLFYSRRIPFAFYGL